VYRFGQRRPVCIYRLVCASTLEASMSNRQAFKLALAQRVLDNREMEGLLPNAAMHR
jgi:SNF2 family DNA or RNA helicase